MHVAYYPPERFAKRTGPGRAWVGRLAPKLRRRLQVVLTNGLQALKGGIALGELERAILAGDRKRILDVSMVDRVGSLVGDLGEPLQQAVKEGGRLAMAELRQPAVALDMGAPRMRRWLRDHGAELVREVNGTSRAAVRGIVNEGFRLGRHPRHMARDVRAVVGLTEPQAISLARRQAAMLEAGVSEANIERRMARVAERMIKRRAETIARTETMTAINRGRHELWRQLEEDGALEPGAQRQWLTSDDERVCPICGPMDQQVTRISGSYTLPGGASLDHPPAHPACRCTEVIM